MSFRWKGQVLKRPKDVPLGQGADVKSKPTAFTAHMSSLDRKRLARVGGGAKVWSRPV